LSSFRAPFPPTRLIFRFLNEFCTLDPLESSDTCDFVDLLKNEEKYTGFAGESANRIWSKIYTELCFLPEEVTNIFCFFIYKLEDICRRGGGGTCGGLLVSKDKIGHISGMFERYFLF
jgi:hypothetical protein